MKFQPYQQRMLEELAELEYELDNIQNSQEFEAKVLELEQHLSALVLALGRHLEA